MGQAITVTAREGNQCEYNVRYFDTLLGGDTASLLSFRSVKLTTSMRNPNDASVPDECAICLKQFDAQSGDEKPQQIMHPQCKHIFGHRCLAEHFSTGAEYSAKCPLCRTPLLGFDLVRDTPTTLFDILFWVYSSHSNRLVLLLREFDESLWEGPMSIFRRILKNKVVLTRLVNLRSNPTLTQSRILKWESCTMENYSYGIETLATGQMLPPTALARHPRAEALESAEEPMTTAGNYPVTPPSTHEPSTPDSSKEMIMHYLFVLRETSEGEPGSLHLTPAKSNLPNPSEQHIHNWVILENLTDAQEEIIRSSFKETGLGRNTSVEVFQLLLDLRGSWEQTEPMGPLRNLDCPTTEHDYLGQW